VACFATVSAASATTVKCQQTVAKAAGAYAQARAKFLAGCEQAKIKGKLPASTMCTTEPKTLGNLTKAADKLNKDIATACGGKDKICGVDTDGTEDSPSSISFPSTCQNLENGTCNGAINHCGDVAQCLKMRGRRGDGPDQHALQRRPRPGTTGDKVLNKCQSTISAEASKFLQAKSKILQKCWDSRLSGKHNDSCPDQNAALKTPAAKAFDDIAKRRPRRSRPSARRAAAATRRAAAPTTSPSRRSASRRAAPTSRSRLARIAARSAPWIRSASSCSASTASRSTRWTASTAVPFRNSLRIGRVQRCGGADLHQPPR